MKHVRQVLALATLIVTVQLVVTLTRLDEAAQRQDQQEQKAEAQNNAPQASTMIDSVVEEITVNATSRGKSKIKKLDFCMLRKVASSASTGLLKEWETMPKDENGGTFQMVIIRDPLERLWSGFWNKCLNQIEREPGQCPHYKQLYNKEKPPFAEWLRKSADRPGPFFANPHFKPMSSICPINRYPNVYRFSDPDFNKKMNEVWKNTMGVNGELVDRWFPVESERKREFYHSNAADGIESHFDCITLRLALKLTARDYHGQSKAYFPLPKWARDMSIKCEAEKKGLPKRFDRIPKEQRFWEKKT